MEKMKCAIRTGLVTKVVNIGLLATALGWCNAARADDVSAGPAPFKLSIEPDSSVPALAPKADDWHVVTRLGLWAISIDGDASVGEYDTDFSMGFDDLLDKTNFALMPGIEISKGKWTLTFNGVFTQLENDGRFNGTLPGGAAIEGGADVQIDMYIADLAVGYRLWDIPLGNGKSDMMLSIIPAVGVRYTYFSVEVNPDRFDSRDRSKSLWDPYIGGRVNLQITKDIAWRTDASIGGFGVGSELTWSAQTFIDWRFHKNLELNIGYRAIYWDYEEGNFKLDTTMHGPWIGLSIHWE